jgi:beta-glucosidase
VQGTADWIGVNYYTPFRIAPAGDEACGATQDVRAYPGAPPFGFAPRMPVTAMGWEVEPVGLEQVLLTTARRAPGVTLRVTENGAAYDDLARTAEGVIDDQDRIAYLRGHIAAVERARAAGAPVHDYIAWTLLDNFEWAEGYTKRFGIVEVQPGTLDRRPKASYAWYAEHVRAATRGRPAG